MKIKETLKGFNIKIDYIEPCDFEAAIKDLCKNVALELDKQRYEIVLNKNIIDIKDTFTNIHSYMGLKLSLEPLEKDISFIIRPTNELTYNELQQENKQLKDLIDTILNFSFFKEECPLSLGFEDNSKEDETQSIFYDDEWCENNCNYNYKDCWLKYFKELQGSDNK